MDKIKEILWFCHLFLHHIKEVEQCNNALMIALHVQYIVNVYIHVCIHVIGIVAGIPSVDYIHNFTDTFENV